MCLFKPMFIAAIFTIDKNYKGSKFINWWMDEQNLSIYTMEYYLTMKRNKVLIHASDTYYNMDEPKIIMPNKEPRNKPSIVWYYIYVKFLEKPKPQIRTVIAWGQRWEWRLACKQVQRTCWGNGSILGDNYAAV